MHNSIAAVQIESRMTELLTGDSPKPVSLTWLVMHHFSVWVHAYLQFLRKKFIFIFPWFCGICHIGFPIHTTTPKLKLCNSCNV